MFKILNLSRIVLVHRLLTILMQTLFTVIIQKLCMRLQGSWNSLHFSRIFYNEAEELLYQLLPNIQAHRLQRSLKSHALAINGSTIIKPCQPWKILSTITSQLWKFLTAQIGRRASFSTECNRLLAAFSSAAFKWYFCLFF